MDKPFLDKLRKIDPYVPGEQPKTAERRIEASYSV